MSYHHTLLSIILFSFVLVPANAIDKIPVSVNGKSGIYDPTAPVHSANDGERIYVEPNVDSSLTIGSTGSSNGISIMSVSSNAQLVRWPSHERPITSMENNTAYFRDPYVGLRFTVTATNHGDNWAVGYTHPVSDGSADTTEIMGSRLTYYQEVGGAQHCFYFPGWFYYVCGSKSITVTNIRKSQCEPAGPWIAQVYENDIAAGAAYGFFLMPEVPPQDMGTALNQRGNTHGYDSMCYYNVTQNRAICPISEPLPDGATRFTIHQKGCAMSAAGMVAKYHGADIEGTAGLNDLNDWLDSNNGFAHNINILNLGLVNWFKVAEYGRLKGADIHFVKDSDKRNDEEMRQMICEAGAQVIAVRNSGHFVTIVGRDGFTPADPWKITDPWGGVTDTNLRDARERQYNNTYNTARYYKNNERDYTDFIYGFMIYLNSPAELLVEGPSRGLKGLDPISGVEYDDIPNTAYYEEGIDDDETGEIDHRTKIFSLLNAGSEANGDYKLNVIGTDTGTYDLDVVTYGRSGKMVAASGIRSIPISEGETHSYNYTFSATHFDVEPKFTGGYDGGGQRPHDVNKFLAYSNPSQARTSLPLGTTDFRLSIYYNSTIQPGSFSADLNGVDITPIFNPAADASEVITIPLQSGRNVLKLSIDGMVDSGRIATDTDRLVFLVK